MGDSESTYIIASLQNLAILGVILRVGLANRVQVNWPKFQSFSFDKIL